MILKSHCTYCKKKVDISREIETELFTTRYYACGHSSTSKKVTPNDFSDVMSTRGHKLMPFQLDGAAFAVNSGYRCLIGDECGLGKTVQAVALLKKLPDVVLPTLIICKSGLKMQWMRETHAWAGHLGQIVTNEKEPSLGLPVTFISMDLLYRFKDFESWTKEFGFKLIILDECQAIKNHDSKRTNAVRRLAQHVPYFIALSGTAIKNHAGEYFPILNLLRPDLFPTMSGFYADWTDTYYNGYSMKTGGLRNANAFREYTKSFIIRRTKAEVMSELPRVSRVPLFSELGKDVEKAYKATMNDFTDYYNSGQDQSNALMRASCILAFFTKMRHLTGLSKIDSTVAFTEEFLMSSEKKIVIFLHHKDVATLITDKLTELCASWPAEYGEAPLTLESKHSPQERQAIIDAFQSGKSRVLVASTLAAGEGVDGIQKVCSDIVILERQWNPANEEQVEGRIERMGQDGTKLTATYMIATGTIDEFFAELVEKKRSYVQNTLDGKDVVWSESNIMKELAEALAASGSKKWKY
jgi:SNF2 family DNA or RNA helicase